MSTPLEAIIDEDLALLCSESQIGKIGQFIGHGSYGFVLEYLDDSGEEKVIKILDPKYVACSFQTVQPKTHVTLLSNRTGNQELEWNYAQQIGYTKSPHLMPLMAGPRKLVIENDRTLHFLVMPRLNTIEHLAISPEKEQQIVSILTDCCSGLQVLHRHPQTVGGRKNGMDALVHCDIKPNNIFYQAGDPPCFLLGDFSIAQKVTELQQMPITIDSPPNSYCATGALCVASDIYSLGWVLYYWMNDKKHPTQQEVADRKRDALAPPAAWGNNPELWEVFLNMTSPLIEQIPNAHKTKSDLIDALQRRQKRLSQIQIAQQYGKGKAIGRLETAGLGVAISAGCYILKKLFSSVSLPADAEGLLHGNVRHDIPLPHLGGFFHGKWEHGCPKEGTYISPTGTKRAGQWKICQNSTEPFLRMARQDFTGLSFLEKGYEISYQGHATIQWPWGTQFECNLEAGNVINGVMTFSDGLKRNGEFSYHDDNKPFPGMLYQEPCGHYTGCIGVYIGTDVYVECELIDNVPGAGCILLPNVRVHHSSPFYTSVLNLLITMLNVGGHFKGNWDNDGFPQDGTYVSENGETATGTFSFVMNKAYPHCIYTGMVGDDGLPWGIGSIQMPDGGIKTGEFWAGTLRIAAN